MSKPIGTLFEFRNLYGKMNHSLGKKVLPYVCVEGRKYDKLVEHAILAKNW